VKPGKVSGQRGTIRGVRHSLDDIRADCGPAIARVVASYAPPGPDREDLAQEVALALVRAMPQFRGEASLRTFVLRVAHNVGLRSAIKRRETTGEPYRDSTDPRPSPEQQVAVRRGEERLLAAVRELPVGLRQALTLALEELSHREISHVLGISENAVAIRLHRARALLKGLLETS